MELIIQLELWNLLIELKKVLKEWKKLLEIYNKFEYKYCLFKTYTNLNHASALYKLKRWHVIDYEYNNIKFNQCNVSSKLIFVNVSLYDFILSVNNYDLKVQNIDYETYYKVHMNTSCDINNIKEINENIVNTSNYLEQLQQKRNALWNIIKDRLSIYLIKN